MWTHSFRKENRPVW